MVKEQCYLCGGEGNITRDHIPPKGLFAEPRPSNLITVPCCEKCNHDNHKRDEQFRIFASIPFNRNIIGTDIWEKKVLPRTIKRRRQRSFVKQMIGSSETVVTSVAGTPMLKKCIICPQSDITPTLIRIVKGLLYTYFPQIPRNFLRFDVVQIDQLRLKEEIPFITKPHCCGERGNGVFRYWGEVMSEAPDVGFWILHFYDATGFAIFHQHQNRNSWDDNFNDLLKNVLT
jgi:hypothetical protein